MVEMEFEMKPGAKVTTNRNVALISLHQDFKTYLMGLNNRVRPIDLPLMTIKQHHNPRRILENCSEEYYYSLSPNAESEIYKFAKEFDKKFPEVEQVYVFSKWSGGETKEKGGDIYGTETSRLLGRALNEIILKRFLIINCFVPREEEKKGDSIGWGKTVSSDEEIRKTLERSLSFNSW